MTSATVQQSALPGRTVVSRIRALIVFTLGAAVVYGLLTSASSATCVADSCISLTLRPNPLIFVALVAIVVIALSVALRWATTEEGAVRYLTRAAVVVAAVAIASIVISQVWFALIPVAEWDGVTANYLFPFPFGSVDVDFAPSAP